MRTSERGRRRPSKNSGVERRPLLAERLPYLAAVRPPAVPGPVPAFEDRIEVATYNVHRWAGVTGGRRWLPELASDVIGELGSDVIGLQEVLRPFGSEDPLERIADELQLYLAFVSTRPHRRGELGNAILSRWPMTGVFTLDLSVGRLERRSAIAAQFRGDSRSVAVVATHLGLVDRTRKQQVRSLLAHPRLQGPTVLLGDMNAWRRCAATRQLDREFTERHHNKEWPPTFPAARPILALDRVYARGARVSEMRTHSSRSARRGSDHLPVVATIELGNSAGAVD
ncbi:MAG: endonuclease/exonuclease/phosphatase family protein [Myxococcota bacterium]